MIIDDKKWEEDKKQENNNYRTCIDPATCCSWNQILPICEPIDRQ